MDLLVHVHVEGPLDKGQRHLQGLGPQLGTVLRDELQPLDPHQAAVAGRILLQVLHTAHSLCMFISHTDSFHSDLLTCVSTCKAFWDSFLLIFYKTDILFWDYTNQNFNGVLAQGVHGRL